MYLEGSNSHILTPASPFSLPLSLLSRPSAQVLEQKTSHVGSGTLMGSDHVYVIPSAAPTAGAALTGLASSKPLTAAEKKMKELIGGETVTEVDVSFTPEEIEGLDEKAIKALYEVCDWNILFLG